MSLYILRFILQSSFVYVFDGLPRFLGNGVVHSDHNLIGAFCGTTRAQPITVEATSGIHPYIHSIKKAFKQIIETHQVTFTIFHFLFHHQV